MVNWKQDFVLSIVLFVSALMFYVTGLGYPDTTALFPSHLSPILGFLAVLLGISAFRRREGGVSLVNWGAAKAPVLVVLLTAAFIVILPYLGFMPSCTLLAASLFLSLGYPNKTVAIAVAVMAPFLIWCVFHLALGVSLPEGTLLFSE